MIEVRKATLADIDDLVQITKEAHQFKLAQGDMAWETKPFTRGDIRHSIQRGTSYIVESDGQPAGRVVLTWEDEKAWSNKGKDRQAGYIHALAVRDAFRGQHLGEEIVDWCCEQIRMVGRQYARLDCPAGNKKLCAYYERQGFRQQAMNSHNYALYERSV